MEAGVLLIPAVRIREGKVADVGFFLGREGSITGINDLKCLAIEFRSFKGLFCINNDFKMVTGNENSRCGTVIVR